MLSGAPSERFAIVITIGSRIPATLNTTSAMNASPCDVVAE